MGRKKKIGRLVDAVAHLFANPIDRKNLRKAAAFEAFLEELRARRAELAARIADGGAPPELEADVELLDAQIEKAGRLLAALREG
jgi:hypothetical protein